MQLTALSTTQCGAVSVQAAARRPAAAAPPRPAAAAAAALQRRQRPAAGGCSSGRGRLVVTAAVKVQKGKQMLCSKTMKAKEGHEDQLRQLCQGVADFSRQRISDRSAGVLAFELSEVRRTGRKWHRICSDASCLLCACCCRRRRRAAVHLVRISPIFASAGPWLLCTSARLALLSSLLI